jgi:metal-responsive CopG/Arc/MetJ family transcriptional regulator
MSDSNEELKTVTISLPTAMAAKAEAWAVSEGRTVSEVFSEALQDYMSETVIQSMEDIRRYALTRNPHGYTEEDIPGLIREVRAEMAAEEAALESAKAS